MKTRASIILLALALTQVGCKTDLTTVLITSLSAVSSSSAVAIAVVSSLESGGQIQEATAHKIIAYAQAVSEVCAKSVVSLNSGETTAVKALSILSAITEVEAPVIETYGDEKAKAVVAVMEAALTALRAQLQAASKDAKTAHATMRLTDSQWAQIRRIGREAERTAQVAARWTQAHPALVAAR